MGFDRLALGTRKGLLIFDRDDSVWSIAHEVFPGVRVSIVFLDRRSGHLFACLDDGHFGCKLFRWNNFLQDENWRSQDPKEVWTELTTPAYPQNALLPNGKEAVQSYLWGMATGSDQQPGRLYLGTVPGGLFVSDDDGDSFELVESLWNHPSRLDKELPWFGGGMDQAGIHSICVDPRNDQHLRVGISCAGVFESTDAGQTWGPTNKGLTAEFLPNPTAEVGHDPHLLVQCQNQPDVFWQQNHCGVFNSTDNGQTWNDVSIREAPAFFGFAVTVDPEDGQTAWIVPAESDQVRAAVDRKLCVSRTNDGGKSWQRFSNGLPQESCFDFALRHCLLYRENSVVFGTACGSLYLSDDRGENWATINNHLPPIYCVHDIS